MTEERTTHATPHTDRVASGQVASWWSVERLLYGLALAIGLSVRLWALGAQPLSALEASNSWPAWLTANGLGVADAPTPNSAFFYALQWLLFWTGVNSDAGARFLSAVAGAALVVLPWWWRSWCGRRVALLMSFLLAIDPWLLGFSRLADGASVGLLCGLLLLVGMSRVAEGQTSETWRRITAVAAGLMLVSGPMGWNFLPVVILWGWLLRDELAVAGVWQRRWLLWAAGAAFVGATAWFARLDGIAWIASGMSVWLSQFDGNSPGPLLPPLTGGYDLGWPWLRLLVDAALLLVFGAGGLATLILRARRGAMMQPKLSQLLYLCVGWLLWGGLLWLMPGRSPFALPMVGLPLLLLTAFALDVLVVRVPHDLDWREAGAVVLTLLILLVSGTFWLAALLANRSYDPVLAQATLVIFGLGLAILVAFGVWANRTDAAWVAAAVVACLLVVVYVRSSWKLNFANVISEPAGWQAVMAHPELRLLVNDMETLSSHRAGDPHELPVQVQVASYVTGDDQVVPARPDPVVGWELRNMRNLTWVTAPHVEEDSDPLPLVVTPATASEDPTQLDLPTTYAGSRYHVDRWWLPRTLVEEDTAPAEGQGGLGRLVLRVQPWWRWTIYREPTEAPFPRDIILWAPLD